MSQPSGCSQVEGSSARYQRIAPRERNVAARSFRVSPIPRHQPRTYRSPRFCALFIVASRRTFPVRTTMLRGADYRNTAWPFAQDVVTAVVATLKIATGEATARAGSNQKRIRIKVDASLLHAAILSAARLTG